jgi:hypothetical protein
MKKLFTKICVMLAIVLIATSLGAFPATYAEQTTAQDQTMAFIENVLPVDLSKYNITLTHHSTDEGSPIVGITGLPISRVVDSVRYTLDSDESTLRVSFQVQNNVVMYCQVIEKNGSVISDKQYANLVDAVKSFLEKYQTYTKIDSSNMIAMLDNVDVTKDSTITIGNTKLVISNIDKYGVEQTSFKWAYTVNGADYTSLQVSYRNGSLYSLGDDRAIYTIGDTSVKISSEQAIDIAMKYLPNYSYDMPNDVTVSGFNVTEDLTTTELVTYPIHSTELRPYWKVKLYLNQTYPGSVKGFTINVWANSGELFSCTNIATGGVEYDDSSDLPTPTTEGDNSLSESTPSSPDMLFAVGIAVAVIGLATASVVIIKKRKK